MVLSLEPKREHYPYSVLTCPVRLEEPIDHIEPSATSQAAPKSGSIVWVWLSPQSSECFPGTLVETRDPGQTRQEVINVQQTQNKKHKGQCVIVSSEEASPHIH